MDLEYKLDLRKLHKVISWVQDFLEGEPETRDLTRERATEWLNLQMKPLIDLKQFELSERKV